MQFTPSLVVLRPTELIRVQATNRLIRTGCDLSHSFLKGLPSCPAYFLTNRRSLKTFIVAPPCFLDWQPVGGHIPETT